MRTKTRCRRWKRPRSVTRPSLPTVTQDEDSAGEFETSHESDDLRDVPMASCIDQHSNGRSVLHDLNHESIDLLDKHICVFCNEGEEVLVCCENDCRVALHAKCNRAGPKFDDLGNFYCPHCWYERAVNKRKELKKKVMVAKKALLSILDENVVTGVKLMQTDEDAKRKEFHAGERFSLGGDDGQDTDDDDVQPLQPKGDRPRKLRKEDSDQYEIALEGQADTDGGCRPCREEVILLDLCQDSMNREKYKDSMNREKYNKTNKSEKDEIRVLERKESFETEDSICNEEEILEINGDVGEEAEPLTASNLGKLNNEHSPVIAFVKGTQESVANSTEGGRMTDKGKMPRREQKVSATDSSVSETNDSDSDVISGRKSRDKRKVQRKAHPHNAASVRKSLFQEHNTKGENASDINEEVTSSKTRRQSQRLKQPVKNRNSLTLRRNKLLWTAEEETALEEGVLRFSRENQTIPWTRILEFGCHVFHRTRTPVDLKDKWRNISLKEDWQRLVECAYYSDLLILVGAGSSPLEASHIFNAIPKAKTLQLGAFETLKRSTICQTQF